MDIKPLFYQGLNCIDVLVVSYAKYLGREVELIFSKSWSFYYDSTKILNSHNFGNNFGVDNSRLTSEQYNLLGFGIDFKPIIDFDTFIEYLKQMLQNNKPVGIFIDSYYCPWHSRFGIDHGNHYVLAYNMMDDNEIICIDPGFNGEGYEKLPLDLLKKGHKKYFVIDDYNVLTQHDYSKIFFESIKNLQESNISYKIKDFSECFMNYFDYAHECKEILSNPWACDVFRNFISIVGGRRQFVQYLNHIITHIQLKNYDDILKSFNQICSKWDTVRWFLVKTDETVFNKKYKEKIYNILLSLAEDERLLIERLNQYHDNTEAEKNNRVVLPSFTNLIYKKIDLSEFLNNKAFSYLNKESADFSGLSEWYCSEEDLVRKAAKLCEQFDLYISDKNNIYDNVTCFQQKIEIPVGRYREIALIASSDFDSFTTTIKLVSEEYNIFELDFMCSTWTEPQNFTNEMIVLECSRGHKHVDGNIALYNDVGYVYKYTLQVPNDVIINSIILPLCPNVHIYAMNLAIESQ